MTKLLLANGCSWTAGNGIDKDKSYSPLVGVNNYTWPAVLSKSLGYTLINLGLGGGSNKRILRTTVDFLLGYSKEQQKNLLVVIGWTTPDRDEIFIDGKWYCYNAGQVFSGQQPMLSEELIKDVDRYQKFYVTHIYNQKIEVLQYYHQKYLLSNLLENLNIKYIFFDSLPPHWGPSEEERIEHYKNMRKIETVNMILETDFNDFINKNNIQLSECNHPMVDGHKKWASYLYNKVLELYGDI